MECNYKKCSKCSDLLPYESFGKRKYSKDGRRSECKVCRRNDRENNIDKYKEQDAKYRKKNKIKRNERSKAYYKTHKSEKSAYDKIYYLTNKDKIIKNHNELAKIKRKTNKNFLLRGNISRAINGCLKKKNSSKNGNSCLKYLPFTIDELKHYLETKFESWMSWDNYGKYNSKTWDDNDSSTWTWQIDHIIPQSNLLYESMEDKNFIKCWSLSNLRPLSSKQNLLDGINRTRHKNTA